MIDYQARIHEVLKHKRTFAVLHDTKIPLHWIGNELTIEISLQYPENVIH